MEINLPLRKRTIINIHIQYTWYDYDVQYMSKSLFETRYLIFDQHVSRSDKAKYRKL